MSNDKKFLTDDQRKIIGAELAAEGATDEQIDSYLELVERTRLDHFARQIMGQVRRKKLKATASEPERYVPVLSPLVTIDGFRLIAERTGQYAGQLGPWWCGKDGVWSEVWLGEGAPFAAKIGVVRKDFKDPLYGVARFSGYSQGNNLWLSMPDMMIAKCAEALALRRAFPHDLGNVYEPAEMEQAENGVNFAPGESPRHQAIRESVASEQPPAPAPSPADTMILKPEAARDLQRQITKPAGPAPQQTHIDKTPSGGSEVLVPIKDGEPITVKHLLDACRRFMALAGKEAGSKRLASLNTRYKCGKNEKGVAVVSLCPADSIASYLADIEEEISYKEHESKVSGGMAAAGAPL